MPGGARRAARAGPQQPSAPAEHEAQPPRTRGRAVSEVVHAAEHGPEPLTTGQTRRRRSRRLPIRHNQPTMTSRGRASARRDASVLARRVAGRAGVLAYVFFAPRHPRARRRAGGTGRGAVGVVELRGGGAHLPAAALDRPHGAARPAARPRSAARCPRVARRGRRRRSVAGLRGVAGARAAVRARRAWFPLLVVGGRPRVRPSSAWSAGTLSARHRFTAVGAGLVAENGLRCVLRRGADRRRRRGPDGVRRRAWSSAAAAVLLWPSALRAAPRRDRRPRRPPLAFVSRRLGRPAAGPGRRSPAARCCWRRSAERRAR